MAARIFYYINGSDESKAVDWAKAVFDASYAQGRDCSDPAVLSVIAKDLGLDGEELLNAAAQDDIKQRFKQATADAMQKGVFGAPTFFIGGDMYWGSDRIDQMHLDLGR